MEEEYQAQLDELADGWLVWHRVSIACVEIDGTSLMTELESNDYWRQC